MREKLICRQCEAQSIIFFSGKSAGRRPFAIAGSSPHYAPDRPFKLEHILFNVKVDPRSKELSGTVTQRVKVVAPDQHKLKLDQVGLQIEEVSIGKEKADFSLEGN